MAVYSDLNEQFYDVVIVGGGMVGAAQAVALAKQKKRVLVIEKYAPSAELLKSVPLRVSAINLASEQYLTDLGIWQHIDDNSKCMFTQLATWEERHNSVLFSADDINKKHLGYLIRNEALQLAAFEQMAFDENNMPSVITNYQLTSIKQEAIQNEQVNLTLTNTEKNEVINISCSLLIGADGAFSQVRSLVNIGTTGWDYQQHCLSLTIKTDFPTQRITWQEFQPSGPKAFLPLEDGYSTLIWYDSADEVKRLSGLTYSQLKEMVLKQFPALVGDFDVVAKASFPLTRRQANQYVKGRVVLTGDSAHTINPLAGQGVNIGYKDVQVLSELLMDVDLTDFSSLSSVLSSYQKTRKRDAQLMSLAMDSFYGLFSNDHTPVKVLRGTMLNIANKFQWAKKQVLKKAVGY